MRTVIQFDATEGAAGLAVGEDEIDVLSNDLFECGYASSLALHQNLSLVEIGMQGGGVNGKP